MGLDTLTLCHGNSSDRSICVYNSGYRAVQGRSSSWMENPLVGTGVVVRGRRRDLDLISSLRFALAFSSISFFFQSFAGVSLA